MSDWDKIATNDYQMLVARLRAVAVEKSLKICTLGILDDGSQIHLLESQPIDVLIDIYYIDFCLDLSCSNKMVEWIDQQAKEDRNLRIGIAAVVLALISIVAVAAQLISTLDVSNQIGWQDRLLYY